MADCPTCEYHKQRAQIWRDEAYKLSGHPMPRKETSMTQDEIIEMARQAGLLPCQGIHMGDLKAFAKLVEQRTWVGLIPEEIDGIIEDSIDKVDALIQTMDKLKDKNI